MPVDYSKWDAIELSDDSDIEVHPNVDKRSFIRAKQNQIHQQRNDRRHRISTLKFERIINEGLLLRIDALLIKLDEHKKDVEGDATKSSDEVDEIVYEVLTEVTGDGSLGSDVPPSPPEGVHTQEETISYSQMFAALVDQVKGEVDKAKADEGMQRYAAYITEVGRHKTKVQGLQKDLNVELTRLEKEEASKITSESVHTGFSSSYVSKATTTTPAATITQPVKTAPKSATKKSAQPELLNPSASSTSISGAATAGSEADIEDDALNPGPGEANLDEDEEDIEASPTAKQFAKLKQGDYAASLQFISANPSILAERETDGLLAEAFTAQLDAKTPADENYARNCVHQALLLQYCRTLGRDGVGLFFQRIRTPGHQAGRVFAEDVNGTYARIRSRTAELRKQREEEAANGGGDREQIQLHAVNPGTSINIVTPPPKEQCTTDDERASREIFETFPPGLQRALESASLDRVNEVLGKMSVDEAELVVEQLGEGGMLSLEEGVIDATTEEGQAQWKEIERSGQMSAAQNGAAADAGTEDPGMD